MSSIINKKYSDIWPNISQKKDPPKDNEKYRNEENKTVEGILLYPTTKQDVDSNHTIGGHNFRLMTINLNQEWRNIEKDLISIIN